MVSDGPTFRTDGGGPTGTAILADERGRSLEWHHSVEFDGFVHKTACDRVIDTDDVRDALVELPEAWNREVARTDGCSTCSRSISDLGHDVATDGGHPTGGSERSGPTKVRLTDEGLETPDPLIGRTGVVTVTTPELQMDFTYGGDGVQEYSELLTFPPTDKESHYVPEGHARIDGVLYEVVDDRELNECPECGSDKVDATGDPPRCYTCDTYLEGGDSDA